MSLMDGVLEKLELKQFNKSHVRRWGVINLDTGQAEIRCVCYRCGAYETFPIRQHADAFVTDHRGANGLCPHEKEVTY
jgi:hypothetical protein